MNTTLAQLLNKKSEIKTKAEALAKELKAINDQIGSVKFGAKIGDKIKVPSTQNVYVVAGFEIFEPKDDIKDAIYVQLEVTDKITGRTTLRNMQEATYWFEYQNGQAKSPTRRF